MASLTRAELLGPLLLAGVRVDGKHPLASLRSSTLQDGQTNTADTEDGDIRVFDVGRLGEGSVTGGDTASEETSLLERRLLANCDHRVLGHNGVLRERGAPHLWVSAVACIAQNTYEVEDVLALALESDGTVRHGALALGGSDWQSARLIITSILKELTLSAQVGLSRLAELALLALWSSAVVERDFS